MFIGTYFLCFHAFSIDLIIPLCSHHCLTIINRYLNHHRNETNCQLYHHKDLNHDSFNDPNYLCSIAVFFDSVHCSRNNLRILEVIHPNSITIEKMRFRFLAYHYSNTLDLKD